MQKRYCLGIGLSAIVLGSLACAQTPQPSSRVRGAATLRATDPAASVSVAGSRGPSGGITPNSLINGGQSLSNPSANLKTTNDMSMLNLQNQVARRSEAVQNTANVMQGLDGSLKNVTQNLGGGRAPPSGGNPSSAVRAGAAPGASSVKVVTKPIVCRECGASANRVPATAPRRP